MELWDSNCPDFCLLRIQNTHTHSHMQYIHTCTQTHTHIVVSLLPRVSEDGQLVVWVNFEDHLKLECTRTDANLQLAFDCICANLVNVCMGRSGKT